MDATHGSYRGLGPLRVLWPTFANASEGRPRLRQGFRLRRAYGGQDGGQDGGRDLDGLDLYVGTGWLRGMGFRPPSPGRPTFAKASASAKASAFAKATADKTADESPGQARPSHNRPLWLEPNFGLD